MADQSITLNTGATLEGPGFGPDRGGYHGWQHHYRSNSLKGSLNLIPIRGELNQFANQKRRAMKPSPGASSFPLKLVA